MADAGLWTVLWAGGLRSGATSPRGQGLLAEPTGEHAIGVPAAAGHLCFGLPQQCRGLDCAQLLHEGEQNVDGVLDGFSRAGQAQLDQLASGRGRSDPSDGTGIRGSECIEAAVPEPAEPVGRVKAIRESRHRHSALAVEGEGSQPPQSALRPGLVPVEREDDRSPGQLSDGRRLGVGDADTVRGQGAKDPL